MNIDKVFYHKTFPIAMYCTEKIGVEIALQSGEDANKALQDAKQLVEEFHRNNNPQLYQSNEQDSCIIPPSHNGTYKLPEVDRVAIFQPPAEPKHKKTKEEGYIFLIENATSVKELSTYKPLAVNYPKISEAYDKKLKELTNGK